MESLLPGKNAIVLVLCGDTNPALVTRFKEKYKDHTGEDGWVILGEPMAVVLKKDVGKTEKS